jgi:hypothetical protein
MGINKSRWAIAAATLVLAGCATPAPPPPSANSDALGVGQLIWVIGGYSVRSGSANINGTQTSGVEMTFVNIGTGEKIVTSTHEPDGFFSVAGVKAGYYSLEKVYFRRNMADGSWADMNWKPRTKLRFTLASQQVTNVGRIVVTNIKAGLNTIGIAGGYDDVKQEFVKLFPQSEWNAVDWLPPKEKNPTVDVAAIPTDLLPGGKLPSLSEVSGAMSYILKGAALITNNQTYEELSTVAWDVKKIADSVSGTNDQTPSPNEVLAATATLPAPAASTAAPAPGSAAVPTGSQGYPYAGPGNEIAQRLLSPEPGWTLQTPPRLDPPGGQRDSLVASAILAAWGCEAEAARGQPDRASMFSQVMVTDLQRAYSLRSFGSAPTNGGEYISDAELGSLIAKY